MPISYCDDRLCFLDKLKPIAGIFARRGVQVSKQREGVFQDFVKYSRVNSTEGLSLTSCALPPSFKQMERDMMCSSNLFAFFIPFDHWISLLITDRNFLMNFFF
ncbi:hypothetical protein K7432_011031 [Basidiobolus ranarum]|uniref:Uncharacterized protein n=1 Tax=Basidiobolus ranarum TaxID=34480 RepID=A0ABR2VVC8_9FUNG